MTHNFSTTEKIMFMLSRYCDTDYKVSSCYFNFFRIFICLFSLKCIYLYIDIFFIDFVLNNTVSIPDTVKQLFLVSLV